MYLSLSKPPACTVQCGSVAGHMLDATVDIYSFGILMWEAYMGSPVYEGVAPDKLPFHVVKRGLRPTFPPDTPIGYRCGRRGWPATHLRMRHVAFPTA